MLGVSDVNILRVRVMSLDLGVAQSRACASFEI